MRLRILCLVLLFACRSDVADLPLIPRPASVVGGRGMFTQTGGLTVSLSHPDDSDLQRLAGFFGTWIGTAHSVVDSAASLSLAIDESFSTTEGYRLEVTIDHIKIVAATNAGVFYGLQTLRQLWLADPLGSIPALTVQDQPRFEYRGMMLDVGRHMYPVDFVKRFIDMIALYKMNTFHWHLTEDQGWRIEIKQYPLLTDVGAFRDETMLEKNFDPYVGDGVPHGGFYTQDEVREIVSYAAERFVTVIPEIEMPGHSGAALAAYPELACTPGPFEVHTVWGVKEDIYCPHEGTFEFLENVLTEVIDLFPSRYIHIGGDEAPKRRWEESDAAQAVITREGLADEHELQSYFIRRIERFLLQNDRRLIGWDEILEGGLAPQATVMSWRGMTGGIEAARKGHDVIMTPTSHVYFDYYQGEPEFEPLAIGGYLPLERVYSLEPVPEELTVEVGVMITSCPFRAASMKAVWHRKPP